MIYNIVLHGFFVCFLLPVMANKLHHKQVITLSYGHTYALYDNIFILITLRINKINESHTYIGPDSRQLYFL